MGKISPFAAETLRKQFLAIPKDRREAKLAAAREARRAKRQQERTCLPVRQVPA